MVIALYCRPSYRRVVPQAVAVTDITLSSRKSEKAFRAYLHEIGYLPVHVVEGGTGRRLVMPSGVVVQFTEGKLHSVTHSQQHKKEGTDAPLSDEREPSVEQIDEMLVEAKHLAETGLVRAGIVLAWAGLEAVLRRLALNAGLQGRIGIQPTILMRELFAANILPQDDSRFLEEVRQIRMAVAHGLKPAPIPAKHIFHLVDLASRLLAQHSDSRHL